MKKIKFNDKPLMAYLPILDVLVAIGMLQLLKFIESQSLLIRETLLISGNPTTDLPAPWISIVVQLAAYGLLVFSLIKIVYLFRNRLRITQND